MEDAELIICEVLGQGETPYLHDGEKALNAALARPMASFDGKMLFDTPIMQAAALLQSVNSHHPLIDGNKRAAWALSIFYMNSWDYEIKEDQEVAAQFVLDSIDERWEVPRIALWFVDRLC